MSVDARVFIDVIGGSPGAVISRVPRRGGPGEIISPGGGRGGAPVT